MPIDYLPSDNTNFSAYLWSYYGIVNPTDAIAIGYI